MSGCTQEPTISNTQADNPEPNADDIPVKSLNGQDHVNSFFDQQEKIQNAAKNDKIPNIKAEK